jgi:predicted nucleic acid-binding protein
VTAIAFADSSALVKPYADEADSGTVRGLEVIVVCELAHVDVPAALWRTHRIGELTPSDTALLVAAFKADYCGTADEAPRFAVVALTAGVLDEAARLVGVHGLRAYDAVQLASATATRDAVDGDVTLAAFDRRLCDAAAQEGLAVLG